jgi:hypothetical protein
MEGTTIQLITEHSHGEVSIKSAADKNATNSKRPNHDGITTAWRRNGEYIATKVSLSLRYYNREIRSIIFL